MLKNVFWESMLYPVFIRMLVFVYDLPALVFIELKFPHQTTSLFHPGV